MSTINTRDGSQIYYKDWGTGQPVVFSQIRANVLADRSKFWKDLSIPFYGFNRPGAKVSEGLRESFWLQGMMCGFPGAYFCIKAFSETDLTEDHPVDLGELSDRKCGNLP